MTNQVLTSAKSLSAHNPFINNTNSPEITVKNRMMWLAGVLIGSLGGLMILIGSCFCVIIEYFSTEKSFGGWLFFIALPLLAFGAHCLDKINVIDKSGKSELVKQL